MRSRIVLGLALAGLFWSMINVYLIVAIADVGELEDYACSDGQPKLSLVIVAGGIALLGIVAVAFGARGSSRVAAGALVGEMALVACWAALGGFSAFDCALDV